MALLEHQTPEPRVPFVDTHVDEGAARRALRDQIAHLERELVTVALSAHPRLEVPGSVGHAGPRLLTLGELEATRDELAGQVADLRAERTRWADRQSEARLLVERMLLEPGKYRWMRVSGADIGEPGCKHWHVRPRLGIIGMLAGWWHVKV